MVGKKDFIKSALTAAAERSGHRSVYKKENNKYAEKIYAGLIVLILITASTANLSAESKSEFDLEIYNTIYRMDNDFYMAGHGNAGLTFKSLKNRNVKGFIEIDFDPDTPTENSSYTKQPLELKKAYVKVRMIDHRITAGKTRSTWGEGTVFNSGDVLFGSLNPYVDLTADEKRTETAWMTVTNSPFGSFSFVELIYMPPQTELNDENITTTVPGGRIEKSTVGGRIYTRIGGTKVEAGYVYKGQKRTLSDPSLKMHRPYISLQGNIGPDWSFSSSAAIPAEHNPDPDIIKAGFTCSMSLFQIINIDHDSSLNLRLETLVLPWHNWEEKTDLFADSADDEILKAYGIFVYPQIVYNISPGLNISLQSVISPVDISAMTTLGFFWNLYQDFEILNYFTVNAGEETDIFAWNSTDRQNMAMTTGFRYRF